MADRRVLALVAAAAALLAAAAIGCGTRLARHEAPPAPGPPARAHPRAHAGMAPVAGWPGPGSTGVPAGVRLTVHTGTLVTTRDGQVIDGVEVRGGGILVRNDGVTIRRSRVVVSGGRSPVGIRVLDGHHGVTVEDCEVDMGRTPHSTGIGYAGLAVRRCDVHGAERGIQIGDHVAAVDNWVHDLYTGPGSHSEDVAIFGSRTPVDSLIQHNTLSNPRSQTAVVLIKTDQGPISGVTVADNYLDGGNYTVYCVVGYYDHVTPPSGVAIVGNVFSRGWVYGATTVDGPVTFSGNTYDDRTPVDRPATAGPEAGRAGARSLP